MTHRERILNALGVKPADRAPFAWWLGFMPWGETLARWRRESGLADLNLRKYFGFEPFFRVVPAEYGPYPHFEKKIISEDAEFVVSVDFRGIVRRDRRDGGSMPEWLEHPIKTHDDWTRYKTERLQPQFSKRLAQLDEFIKATPAADAPVQVGTYPWGCFGTARDLLGAEGLLLAFYDDPEMVRDIMETCTTLWLSLYEKIAACVQIDHIHIWEDMAGKQGSLLSPAMIEEFMMPQYDRLVDFARRHDVPVVSVDSDGQVRDLLPVMTRHGVNAFMPFEAQAGCRVEEYRAQYPHLGLFGGLDKRALAGGRAGIHRELTRAENLLAAGGWIPGFDHLIPPDVPWAEYKYFIVHLRKMIGV